MTGSLLKVAWVFVLGTAAMSVCAQVIEPEQSAETKPEDYVYVAPTRADKIGRVMAPVYVNDVGPFAFLVDTGASSSAIAPRVAKRLNLVPDPARAKLLRGITGSEEVPTVWVDSIRAGEISLARSALPVVEPRVFADADGIFGADAFAQGCLYVNFANSRVFILSTACPRVGSSWETISAKLRFGGLAVVRARIGRAAVAAIIDTGAERSLGNPALLAALGLNTEGRDPGATTRLYAATSQEVFGQIVATPPIRMGGTEVGNLHPVFGDFEVFHLWGVQDEPALVLGMDILGTTQAMMIDFRRKELRLLPQGEENTLRIRERITPTRLPD